LPFPLPPTSVCWEKILRAFCLATSLFQIIFTRIFAKEMVLEDEDLVFLQGGGQICLLPFPPGVIGKV
jgi:hypothetical protein